MKLNSRLLDVKKLKLYVLPSLNLPSKSHETIIHERPIRARDVSTSTTKNVKKFCYENFEDTRKRLTKLKISPLSFRCSDYTTYLELNIPPFLVPRISVKIDIDLKFSVVVYNWPLPDDHQLYKKYFGTLRNVLLSPLLAEIDAFSICSGRTERIQSSRVHSIPLEIDENTENPRTFDEVFRSQDCHVLTLSTLCESCERMESCLIQVLIR